MILDASTLILLAKMELLDAFIENFRRCVISEHVFEESVGTGKDKKTSFDALLIGKRVTEGRIKIERVLDKKAVEEITKTFNLGRGESETLLLGIKGPVQRVAIDDGKAIKAARILGLQFMTALTFVMEQAASGKLSKGDAVEAINKLKLYGRYKKDLIEFALKEVEKNE